MGVWGKVSVDLVSPPNSNPSCLKQEVMTQVRELREREKRADSIVIRGLSVQSVDEAVSSFGNIAHILGVGPVTLVDVVKVGAFDLFRARIKDVEKRRELLLRSPDLNTSVQYKKVYINRNLTWHQRREIQLKRGSAVSRNSAVGTPPLTGGNATPQGDMEHRSIGAHLELSVGGRGGGRGGRGVGSGRLGQGVTRSSSGVANVANVPHIMRNTNF